MTRVRLDVVRSEDGRLSGRLAIGDEAADVPFDGTLELLRLLDELTSEDPASNGSTQ